MLEKKDIQEIKMGEDGSITILEGISARLQMLYSLYFRAVIIKKDEAFYYIQRTGCKDGYVVTKIPYKHITLKLLEEMEEEAVREYMEKKGICVNNPIESLLKSGNAETETIYFGR